MDFKGFKKVGSDGKSTTFKHENGSWLKVAHKGLSKGNIDKLKKLPEHGVDLGALSKAPVQYAQPGQADIRNGKLVPEGFAEGGEVAPQDSDIFENNSRALGRAVYEPEDQRQMRLDGQSAANEDEDSLSGDEMEALERGEAIQGDPGTPDMVPGGVQSEDIPPQQQVPAQAPQVPGRGPASFGPAIEAMPQAAAPAQAAPDAAALAQPADVQAGDQQNAVYRPGDIPPVDPYKAGKAAKNDVFGQANEMALKGLTEQKEGARASAIAEGELGQKEAEADAMAANQLNNTQAQFNDKFNKLMEDRQLMYKDWMEHGTIDPSRFVKNMSTGSKIMAGIGLILGGMGGGLSGQPNLAAEFLQKQIDRDVMAQRLNIENRHSLLRFNLEATGDLFKATELTRGQIMDINSMHLKQLAARAVDPKAKAALMARAGELDGIASNVYKDIAMREALMATSGQGGEQGFQNRNRILRVMGQDKFADEAEKHHVSGVGDSSVAIPDDVRTQIQTRNALDTAIRDLGAFAHSNSGSLNPATIAQGKAKAALVQDMMRQAQNAGVFKESEKDFMNKYIGEDPTQFFERFRAGKGYEEVRKNNLVNLNSLKKVYGLPSNAQENAAAKGTPNVQSRMEGGKEVFYKKVPGGWKKVK